MALPLFMPGDFSVNGARLESELLRGIESAGDPVVMTSGNHDSDALMRSFARRGAIVLTHEGRLARGGSPRPARRWSPSPVWRSRASRIRSPTRGAAIRSGVRATLSFTDLPDGEERFKEAADRYWAWWNALPRRPDVLLIHQAALARDLGGAHRGGRPGRARRWRSSPATRTSSAST